jgi:hypothetical protein
MGSMTYTGDDETKIKMKIMCDCSIVFTKLETVDHNKDSTYAVGTTSTHF